jgi:hypothetical protein
MLARDKHTSLLRNSVNNDRKKFYSRCRRLEVTDSEKHSNLRRYGRKYGRKKFYDTGHYFSFDVINLFLSSLSLPKNKLGCTSKDSFSG